MNCNIIINGNYTAENIETFDIYKNMEIFHFPQNFNYEEHITQIKKDAINFNN